MFKGSVITFPPQEKKTNNNDNTKNNNNNINTAAYSPLQYFHYLTTFIFNSLIFPDTEIQSNITWSFHREQERKCGPDGFLDSSKYTHSFQVRGKVLEAKSNKPKKPEDEEQPKQAQVSHRNNK